MSESTGTRSPRGLPRGRSAAARVGRALRRWACLLALAAGWSARAADVPPPAGDDYGATRDALDRGFAQRLAELADKCAELNLPAQAEQTRRWFLPRDPRRQYLFLPAAVDPLAPAADAPTIQQQWYARLRAERRQQAAQLFQLARQQLDAGQAARSFQLLHETLREDPDHEAARAALGFRRVNQRWARPTAQIRARSLRPVESSVRFEGGSAWVVDSENFTISTDHSESAGVRLAEQLEQLYGVWEQLFFDYWSSPASLARRFESGGSSTASQRRHKVVLFRDRDEYLRQLKPSGLAVEISLGMYLEGPRTSFFYVAADALPDLYYHEVTHQLFSETGRVKPGAGLRGNSWVIEAVALYMESLQHAGDAWTVGGVDASRLQFARYRLLHDGIYLPLTELVRLGRKELQQHPEIRRLYVQASGLGFFLMDDRRGRYRRALVDYLREVYAGTDGPDTLRTVTRVELAELDRQYREFVNVTDEDLAALAAIPTARDLSLGHTAVTDQGLMHLAGHRQLYWLDLTGLPISDTGLAYVRQATGLRHLIADGTRITDASLPLIAGFRELEILDLTDTGVTDAGLAKLAPLTGLKELWLGQTALTDAGLEHLRGLKNLETLEVANTAVTTTGLTRLKAALPSLRD